MKLSPDWSLSIRVDGKEFTQAELAVVIEVRVLQDTQAPGSFEIAVEGWDDEKKGFRLVDDLAEGAKVEIGIKDTGGAQPIFTGELTALELELVADTGPRVRLRGYDVRHKLMRARQTRTFLKSSDSEIAETVGSKGGVPIKAEKSSLKHPFILQADQTDWDFLRQRAAAIGFEIALDGADVVFRQPPTGKRPAVTLSTEVEMIEFRGTLSLMSQVDTLEVRGWDPATKKEIVGKSAADSLPVPAGAIAGPARAKKAFKAAPGTCCDLPVGSVAEADLLAESLLIQRAMEHASVDIVALGNPALAAGTTVKVDGVGKRFGGNYYISSATHHIADETGYRTTLKVRRIAS